MVSVNDIFYQSIRRVCITDLLFETPIWAYSLELCKYRIEYRWVTIRCRIGIMFSIQLTLLLNVISNVTLFTNIVIAFVYNDFIFNIIVSLMKAVSFILRLCGRLIPHSRTSTSWLWFLNFVQEDQHDCKAWLFPTHDGHLLLWFNWAQVSFIVLLSLQRLQIWRFILWRSSEDISCLFPLSKSTYGSVYNLLKGVTDRIKIRNI